MAKLAQSSFALDFLRRLLCAHTPGNAAADGVNHTNTVHAAAAAAPKEEEEEEEGAEARSPCIVARLMGLDAMPTPARRDQNPTLRRSRSASSAEGRSSPSSPKTPCCFGDAPRRRVVRTTSASFSDRPTYLRRENDEFLLLSFSPDDDGTDDREATVGLSRNDDDAGVAGSRRGKKWVDGAGAKKQRRAHRRLPRRRRGDEDAETEHGRSKRPAAEAEENSSPVSVLEARDGHLEESSTTTTASSSSSTEETEQPEEPWSPSSDGGETRPAPRRQQQGSRRKLLRPDFDGIGGEPPSCISKCSDSDRRDRRVVNKGEVIAPDATGVWRIICKMIEQDLCGIKWEARGGGDIAAKMESEILDQLIWEQTDELMQLIVV